MAEPVRARRLTDQEGQRLQQIVRRGKHGSIRVRRAMIIMASASGALVPAIAPLRPGYARRGGKLSDGLLVFPGTQPENSVPVQDRTAADSTPQADRSRTPRRAGARPRDRWCRRARRRRSTAG
jgi:hypothetical protein